MEEEKREVHIGGRGLTPYKPEFDNVAYKYCLMGATDEELAKPFEVASSTFRKWKKKYPGLRDSINAGKLHADMNVATSLYKRAIGYSYLQVISEAANVPADKVPLEKAAAVDSAFFTDSSIDFKAIRVTTKEVIPDVKAQIFWLKNRQPKLWREKQEINHTTDGKKMSHITIFELPNDGRND